MIKNNLKNRYILKLLATIINALFNAFILFIIPKSIGPESFGIYSYLTNSFNQLLGLFDGGTSNAYFTKLSQRNHDKKLIVFYLFFIIFLFILLYTIVSVLIFFDLINYFFIDIKIAYIIQSFFIAFLIWFSRVQIKTMDAFAYTFYSEFVKIIYVIGSLILLVLINYLYKIDLTLFLNFLIITSLLYNIILFVATKIKIKWSFSINLTNYIKYIKEFYIYTHPLFMTMLIGSSASLFDFWLLQKYGGSTQQGYYGIAFQIASMSFILVSSITPIITREFANAYAKKKYKRINLLFKKYIPLFYTLASFFAIFVFYYSKFFINLFGDEKYTEAIIVLSIMSFYPMHQTYGQLSGAIFFATNKTELYRNISILFIIIGIFISILLIYIMKLEAIGLALKIIIIQALGVNYQLYINCKYLKISYINILLHQIIVPLIFLGILYIIDEIITIDNNLFNIILNFIIYLLLSLAIFQIWRKNEFFKKI